MTAGGASRTLAISSDSQFGPPGGPLFTNGGTLRPTADATFNRPMVIAPGATATIETTDRRIVWNGSISQQAGAPANLLVTGQARIDPNTGNSLPNLILTGDASWTGTTTVRSTSTSPYVSTSTSPYVQIGNFGTTGSLPAGGAVVLDPAGGFGGSVFLGFARSDDFTFDSTISEIPGNVSGNVFQRGPGTLRLTAANTYTGATEVTGTLIVNGGSLAAGTSGNGTGSVRVGRDGLTGEFSAGTLGGTGRIAGSVTVFPPFTLSQPANYVRGDSDSGIGTLTINNRLLLSAGGITFNGGGIAVQLATTNGSITDHSKIALTGTDGILNLNNLSGGRTIPVRLLNDADLIYNQTDTINLVTAEGGLPAEQHAGHQPPRQRLHDLQRLGPVELSVFTRWMTWPASNRSTSAGLLLSPQCRRWLPRTHRSPGGVIAASGGAGTSSGSKPSWPRSSLEPWASTHGSPNARSAAGRRFRSPARRSGCRRCGGP